MGQSTDAILAYGYDLGSNESGWKIREAGEYGELPALPWYGPQGDDDFQSAAERRLLADIAGFTETDWQVDGYFAREREAKARLGVTFDTYCSGDYPMYLLATHVTTVYRGDTEHIDPADMLRRPAAEGWDAKLTAAVTALGITPVQAEPQWLLCSYWG